MNILSTDYSYKTPQVSYSAYKQKLNILLADIASLHPAYTILGGKPEGDTIKKIMNSKIYELSDLLVKAAVEFPNTSLI